MIDTSRPVRLRRAPEMVGDVTSVGPDHVAITFHSGGSGRFALTDVEQHDGVEAQGKSWPPRLEVK